MKKTKLVLLLAVLVVQAKAQNNAIFRGGTADGWQKQAFLQAGNSIFQGGVGDGWSLGSFAQAASLIFAGGTGDGWSRSAFAQAGNSIFSGGNGDGWTYDAFLQAGNSIFSGGLGDGWASNFRSLGALPVNLSLFKAEKQQSVSLLTWETETEVGTAFFDVQRSADGVGFETIGNVAAAGNSSRRQAYSFTDWQPLSGYNYYRLKQVDKDQRFQFSPVRSLLFDAVRLLSIKAYPVPVVNTLTVELPAALRNQEVAVNIVNSGGVVLQQLRASRNRITDQKQVDVSRLPAGAYTLQVVAPDYASSIVFVKQ